MTVTLTLPRMTSAAFPYPQRATEEQLLNRAAKMLACVFLGAIYT